MGRQTEFFADEVDLADLLAFAESHGYSAVPQIIPTSQEVAEPIPPTHAKIDPKLGADRLFLVPPGISHADAFYTEIKDNPTWSFLMVMTSAVIELIPSARQNDQLERGRIYLALDRHDERYPLAAKGYERLARYIRQWGKTTEGRYRVGPHTTKEARGKRLRLARANHPYCID